METKYDEVNGTISTETTHFSRYMIVDKTAWFEAWSEELNYTNVQYEKSACYTVLAVDCSGSMSSSDPITIIADTSYPYINIRDCKRHDAVVNYVGAMDSDDKAAIVAFDSSATTLCGMTDSKLELSYAARKFYSSGGTNYNNVLTESIAILDNSEGSTRKKIVLLSDGKASVSDSVLESAKSSNIKIYTVGLGNSSDSVLQNIADETGGEFFKAYTADELVDIYEEIGVAVDIDTTDTDGDGLYDVYETAGMRLQNGKIIYTDPLLKDTDGDGLEDGQEIDPEMKQLYASGMPSDVAEIQPYYFVMYSDPNSEDGDDDGILDVKDIYALEYNNYPNLFNDFINDNVIEMDMVRQDDNDFVIALEPLGNICKYYGIDYLESFIDSATGNYDDLTVIFDDWYIYAIPNGDEWAFSIIKMRTSHNEGGVGVSIPFKEFDISLFENEDKMLLSNSLKEIVYMRDAVEHDEAIRCFFDNPNNSTNYFIADLYVELIIQKECINNTINVEIYLPRQTKFLNQHSTIYDEDNQCIYINDVSNPSLIERQCLLITHSGNPSYNSFAAEVYYHADKCGTAKIPFVYNSAKKADMGADEEKDDITDNSYINYNGKYVKQQRDLFGDF